MKAIISIVAVVVLGFCATLAYMASRPQQVTETVIAITKEHNAAAIADTLYTYGIIRSPLAFKVYARLTGADKRLQAGRYMFKGSLGLIDVLNVLRAGRVLQKSVTLPEGLTMDESLQRLAKAGFGNYLVLKELASDSTFAQEITGLPIPSLEGFIYPETYLFVEDASEQYVLRTLVKQFYQKIARLNLTPGPELLKTVTLASIVEREAFYEREMPVIAGVYLNRIKKGMPLQADPTISFIMKKAGIKRRRVLYKDLEVDSPYNTYKYSGLPPGPICNPSLAAIKAVVKPYKSDYLFFFADGHGSHVFSKNYRQHLQRQRLKGKRLGSN